MAWAASGPSAIPHEVLHRWRSSANNILGWTGGDLAGHVNVTHVLGQPLPVTSPMLATRGMPGGMLSVSADANAAGSGIVWASLPLQGDANQGVVPGILRAFDAENVGRELLEQPPERSAR